MIELTPEGVWQIELVHGLPGATGATGPTGLTGPTGVIAATAPATYNAPSQTVGVIVGTTTGSVAAGNDPRLSDARVPTTHAATHGAGGTDPVTVTDASVSATAAIAESKLALASDAAAGVGSKRTLGAGATQAAAGNDSRLSDARTPTVHAGTHATGGTDPVTVTKAQVGLGSVDDTADAAKPVSTAQAAADATKQPILSTTPAAWTWGEIGVIGAAKTHHRFASGGTADWYSVTESGTLEAGLYRDHVQSYGYNRQANGIRYDAAEPQFFVQMESKFRNSPALPFGSEYHLNFRRPNNTGGFRRPLNFFMHHDLDLVGGAISADTFSFTNAAGLQWLTYAGGTITAQANLTINKGATGGAAINVTGPADSSARVTIDALVPALALKLAGVPTWTLYQPGGNVLHVRDELNARSHAQFLPGTGNDNSYTDLYSVLRVRGANIEAGAASQVKIGTLGTTEGWLDSTVALNIRAGGTNAINVLSKTQFNAGIGVFGTAPLAAKRAATADATDLATAVTLVNALKADLVAYGMKTP